MKCLLFIITLFLGSIIIDVQGEDNADYGDGDDPAFLEITKENLSDEPDIEGDEYPLEAETENPPEESDQSTYDGKYDSNGDDSTEAKSSGQESREEKKQKKLSDDDFKWTENFKDEKKYKINEETMLRFLAELKAGAESDLIGENQHVVQSHVYHDLGRRSAFKNIAAENVDYLTPEKAPPELVLLVAKESALLRAGKDNDLENDIDQKNILRSGDYWNGVWKEEVKPKSALRTVSQKKNLGSIKAKINPGTEFYKVVSRMKKISPQLLYIKYK